MATTSTNKEVWGVPVGGTLHAGVVVIESTKTWTTPWGTDTMTITSLRLLCGAYGVITTGDFSKLANSGHYGHCMICRNRMPNREGKS